MTRAETRTHAAHAILSLLSHDEREVIELRLGLRDGHPHTHRDVAEQLAMSTTDVRAAEDRALTLMRERLDPKSIAALLAG
ncbi:MAG: RNA polymerase primary sigma factor [Glaciecola sp.]|jgi:RNA polymerase primary sigma factor